MPKSERAASSAWYAATISRGCEVCSGRGESCEGRLEAHHVIPKEFLKRHGLPELIWHPANGMCLCYKAHRRHTNRLQPIERAFLRRDHFELAGLYRLGWLLDSLYPM